MIQIYRQQIETYRNIFPFPSEEDLNLDPNELSGFRYNPHFRQAMIKESLEHLQLDKCSKLHIVVSKSDNKYRSISKKLGKKKNEISIKVVEDESGYWEDPQALAIRVLLPSTILSAIVGVLDGEK